MTTNNKQKCVVIIAGEVSGDIHGARLIAALKNNEPSLNIQGIGGDLMIQEGLKPLQEDFREWT
jgi:lipid-A-disaccharide synthase